jgi:hypothetical protein
MANYNAARKELTPEEKAARELKAQNRNKVISSCKLICARPNKDGDKVGIAVLNYSAKIPDSTQLDVMSKMESGTAVLSKWCGVTPYLLSLIQAPILTDFGCVLAGDGDCIQLVDILKPEDYKAYLAVVGRVFDNPEPAPAKPAAKPKENNVPISM